MSEKTAEQERIDNLDRRVNECQLREIGAIKEVKGSIDNLYDKIDKITESLQNRLPLWATIMFTAMGSTIVGLVVAIVTKKA